MTTGTRPAQRVAQNPLLTTIGRLGLVGYGVVNLLLAYLVVKVAFGAPESEAEAGKGGAVEHLAENAGGTAVLWAIGVSLFALALWQLAEAVRGRLGGWHRLASAGEAVAYVVLGISAVRAAAGAGSGGSNQEQAGWTARILSAPGGPLIVGIAGVGLAAIATLLAIKGLTRRFLEELDLGRSRLRGLATGLGTVGYLTLGGTYAVVGGLVVAAAARHDPEKATGLDSALASLAEHRYGPSCCWWSRSASRASARTASSTPGTGGPDSPTSCSGKSRTFGPGGGSGNRVGEPPDHPATRK